MSTVKSNRNKKKNLTKKTKQKGQTFSSERVGTNNNNNKKERLQFNVKS